MPVSLAQPKNAVLNSSSGQHCQYFLQSAARKVVPLFLKPTELRKIHQQQLEASASLDGQQSEVA